MSDTNSNTNNQATIDPTNSGTIESQTQTPTTDPKNPEPSIQSTGIPKSQVEELLAKARADEKNKVFSRLESLKKEKTEAVNKLKDMTATVNATQEDLNKLREGKASEMESFNRELVELKKKNETLEREIVAVADTAAQKLVESELKVYREKAIAQSGVQLSELVQGSTPEEINESIAVAKKKEAEIRALAEADIQKKMAAQLPSPIAPTGSHGISPGIISPRDKQSVARLPKDQYLSRRAELLQEAKRKAGM